MKIKSTASPNARFITGENQVTKLMTIILFAVSFAVTFSLFAEPVHPHLMFDQKDVPALRDKVKSGMPKRAYDLMLDRSTKALALTELPKHKGGDLELVQKDPLFELAFAYLLSEDEKYKIKFLSLLDEARKDKVDLHKLGYDVAMIFDLGYNIMGEDNRKYLKDAIVLHADKHKDPNRVAFFPYSNWGMISGLEGARDELVLYGHSEYNQGTLANLTSLTREIFTAWIDDQGAVFEGGSYINYPWVRSGGTHVHMINRKTENLVGNTNLPKLPAYLRQTEMPNGSVPHLGDTSFGDIIQNSALYGLMHLLPDDPIIPQMALKLENNKWYRPDPMFGIILYQPLQKLPLPELPLANSFPQSGIMSYKSAYDDPNAFYTITQSRYARGHAHEDVGTFLLSAYGKDFVTESGYGEVELLKHNMVSINHQTPKSNSAGGIVRQYLLSPHALVMNTNLTNFWNQAKPPSRPEPLFLADWSVVMAERSFIVLPENKTLGIPPYVLVSDYVKKDDLDQDYSWMLQILPNYEIRIDGATAKVIADKDDMTVKVLAPNNPALSSTKWLTEYRFKGKEFQRLETTVRDKVGRFLVVLYPRTDTMPELKVETASKPFQRKLIWPEAVDYLSWSDGVTEQSYELALFRAPKTETFIKGLPKSSQYLLVNVGAEFKIGTTSVVTARSPGGSSHPHDRIRQTLMSVAFDGESLHLDIYTHERMKFQIPYLTEIKAFAPNVKEVICNGDNLEFETEGDYVTVRAYSRVIKSAAELRTPNHEKITRKIEESFDEKPSPQRK